MTKSINVRLSHELYTLLDEFSKKHKLPKSEIIRKAIEQYIGCDTNLYRIDIFIDEYTRSPKSYRTFFINSDELNNFRKFVVDIGFERQSCNEYLVKYKKEYSNFTLYIYICKIVTNTTDDIVSLIELICNFM